MNNSTKPIVLQIEDAVNDIPGWTPIDQLVSLFTLSLSSSHLNGDILELGSWCGRSAVALGMAARITGRTKVHCIDLFPEKNDWYMNSDGTYSFSVNIDGKLHGAYQSQTVWEKPYINDIVPLYESWGATEKAFSHYIAINGLSDCVVSYKSDLETFANKVDSDFRLRLAFIDGDHSYEAVCKDIEIIEKYLLPGGWLCFDDAFSSYEGVNEAIKKKILDSDKYCNRQQLTRKFFVAQRAFGE